MLTDDGSFFLNVGASPSNPLLPHQIVLALTDGNDPLFILQNTFHWIKSITVETRRRRAGQRRAFQADQLEALRQRLPRIRLPPHEDRRRAARPPRRRRALLGQIQHRPLGPHRRRGPALPRQQLVHPLRDHPVARQGTPPSRHLSRRARRAVHPAPRQGAEPACSIPSSASAPPPSRRNGRASGSSPASNSTTTTSPSPAVAWRFQQDQAVFERNIRSKYVILCLFAQTFCSSLRNEGLSPSKNSRKFMPRALL